MHVQAVKSSDGNYRYYFRRRGYERRKLPGLPGSDEFMRAYMAALENRPAPPVRGQTAPEKGTFDALVIEFYQSHPWRNLKPTTQGVQRAIIEKFRAKHGRKEVALLEPKHVQKFVDEKDDTPAAQRKFFMIIRKLLRYGMKKGMLHFDPTIGVDLVKYTSKGHKMWSDEEIKRFTERHKPEGKAYLALTLFLYTGARRSDTVRLGWHSVIDGKIVFTQKKTGGEVVIPLAEELAKVIEACPKDAPAFLMTDLGHPFTAAGFTNWFHDRIQEAGLTRISAHGLRKVVCTQLAEAGCTAYEIMAISGHVTLKEAERYCAEANRRKLGESAMEKLNRWKAVQRSL